MRKTSSLPNSGPDSSDFPYGKIIDQSTGITGTPVIEATYSDFIQNLWHFVSLAGITPNGQADNVTNGFQLARALQMVLDPVGNQREWPSLNNLPPGYVPEDGRSLDKTIYADLYAIIGTTYGGSGNNFNIPNSINRMIVGSGDLYSIGTTGGERTHVLSVDEIPSHSHKMVANVNDSSHPVDDYPDEFLQKDSANRAGNNDYKLQVGSSAPTRTPTSSIGGGAAHNNMPPHLAKNRIIKIQYV